MNKFRKNSVDMAIAGQSNFLAIQDSEIKYWKQITKHICSLIHIYSSAWFFFVRPLDPLNWKENYLDTFKKDNLTLQAFST